MTVWRTKVVVTVIVCAVSLLQWRQATALDSTNHTQLKLGASLVPGQNQAWKSSPNGTFALGFYPVHNGGNSTYRIGIWYAQLPLRTVVWTLNASHPISVGANSTFELNVDGNLALLSGSPQVEVWSSNLTSQVGVVGATLLDSGNFVLLNSSGGYVWESWSYPSDTLLPGQTMLQGSILTVSGDASSNPPVSSYRLSLGTDGNLALYWNTTTNYWQSGTFVGPSTAIPSSAQLNSEGSFQLLNTSGVVESWFSSDYGESAVRRLTIDSDGNLRTYSWDESVSNWSSTWQAISNECTIYGRCGQNGLCVYAQAQPQCTCLPGYELVNPKDSTQGCVLQLRLNCSAGIKMVALENTMLLGATSDFLENNANSVNCNQTCFLDSTCMASNFQNDGTGYCYEKRTEYLSGYQSPTVLSVSYLKLCESQALASPTAVGAVAPSPHIDSTSRIVIGVLAASTASLLALLAWCYYSQHQPKFRIVSATTNSEEYVPGAPIKFSFKELQQATRNFSEKLGAGGFGSVYKGVLTDKTVVAVKQLEDMVEQGERQFRTEVAIIGSTHHMNLVRLHGFCSEGLHRLLVYEYLSNGSLDNFLFQGSSTSSNELVELDWKTRFGIALGTARGITYLHEECRICIVHCDIKPENILLDDRFFPKVSDFGLAKLLGLPGHARNVSIIRGTRGYLAPEWAGNAPLTAKTDVFSFGMVLLEIVLGRRALDPVVSESETHNFVANAYHKMQDGGLVVWIQQQERLQGRAVDTDQVDRTVQIAFWCIQDEASLRPSMGQVVQMLEGTISVAPPPIPKSSARVLVN